MGNEEYFDGIFQSLTKLITKNTERGSETKCLNNDRIKYFI